MILSPLNEIHISKIGEMENNSDTSEFIVPYKSDKHLIEINNPLNRYLGIYENGQLLGFIIIGIEQEGNRIEFRRIVIENKGSGTGQKAIIELEKYCKSLWNTNSIWLDVFEFNHRGIYIYEKLGYKRIDESFINEKRLLVMEKYILKQD
jgi:RimJ/RimL family protein N-acetyltransferase